MFYHLSSLLKSKFVVILFVILGFLIWGNTLPNTLLWDDDDNIVNNAYIKDFRYLPKLFTQNQIAGAGFISNQYRPLLLLTFSLEYHLFKLWSPIYHLTNVLIHIANSIFVFLLIKKLLAIPNTKPQNNSPFLHFLFSLPFLSTLLFLIHPVQTEAVAYVAGRTDLLATFFILLGLILYLSSWPRIIRLILIPLIYLGAILSKEASIVFPALIFVIYRLRPRSPTTDIDQLLLQFPLLLIASFYTVMRLTIFNFQNTLNFFSSKNMYTSDILIRIYTFLSTLPQYLILLFFPLHLQPERTTPILTSLLNFPSLIGLAVLLTSIISAFLFRKKSPLTTYGIIWFYLTIFLSSSILIPVNAIITEHWLYIPSIGIFLIFAIVLQKLFSLNVLKIRILKIVSDFDIRISNLLQLFAISILILLSIKTFTQNTIWRNQISLYTHILKYNPKSARVHNNLGMAYADKKDFNTAFIHYQKAIKLSDTYPQTHHNLANILRTQGKEEEAIKEYKKALKIDPNFIFSYKKLEELLEKRKSL